MGVSNFFYLCHIPQKDLNFCRFRIFPSIIFWCWSSVHKVSCWLSSLNWRPSLLEIQDPPPNYHIWVLEACPLPNLRCFPGVCRRNFKFQYIDGLFAHLHHITKATTCHSKCLWKSLHREKMKQPMSWQPFSRIKWRHIRTWHYDVITTRRRSLGNVICLQACVCPQGGSAWPAPSGADTPPDQVHPPCRACLEIRSTRGR